MNAFEKWSVWTTSILSGVTGLGYFWTKYLVESADPFAVVNHPLEPWLLKAHIVVSPFLLLAVGMIVVGHVWKHFRARITWGRRSGLLVACVFLPLVLSGYLIQAVTDRSWLQALAIVHIVAGLLYLIGLGAHQFALRYLRPPPGKRRLYPLERERRPVGRAGRARRHSGGERGGKGEHRRSRDRKDRRGSERSPDHREGGPGETESERIEAEEGPVGEDGTEGRQGQATGTVPLRTGG